MELTTEQILNYIKFLEAKSQDRYAKLRIEGASYRSRAVTLETGYLNALKAVKDAIERPQKNVQLEEAMTKFA